MLMLSIILMHIHQKSVRILEMGTNTIKQFLENIDDYLQSLRETHTVNTKWVKGEIT